MAWELFQEMQSAGIQADLRTYTTLMNAWVEAGKGDRAIRTFTEMRAAGLEPDAYAWTVGIKVRKCGFDVIVNKQAQPGGANPRKQSIDSPPFRRPTRLVKHEQTGLRRLRAGGPGALLHGRNPRRLQAAAPAAHPVRPRPRRAAAPRRHHLQPGHAGPCRFVAAVSCLCVCVRVGARGRARFDLLLMPNHTNVTNKQVCEEQGEAPRHHEAALQLFERMAQVRRPCFLTRVSFHVCVYVGGYIDVHAGTRASHYH